MLARAWRRRSCRAAPRAPGSARRCRSPCGRSAPRWSTRPRPSARGRAVTRFFGARRAEQVEAEVAGRRCRPAPCSRPASGSRVMRRSEIDRAALLRRGRSGRGPTTCRPSSSAAMPSTWFTVTTPVPPMPIIRTPKSSSRRRAARGSGSSTSSAGASCFAFSPGHDREERRAVALEAGEVLVAGGLVDLRLAAELGLDRLHRQAVGLLAAVAAALAHALVDPDALAPARRPCRACACGASRPRTPGRGSARSRPRPAASSCCAASSSSRSRTSAIGASSTPR